tara:strand:+ start:602 stop:796 length:195 start_codon:yes stop_codon:yes gene_type:complete
MEMVYVHIAIGFVACLITASWGFRAGRDIGIELGIKRGKDIIPESILAKFKQMDMRIQALKKKK